MQRSFAAADCSALLAAHWLCGPAARQAAETQHHFMTAMEQGTGKHLSASA